MASTLDCSDSARIGGDILTAQYRFAAQYVKPGNLLDINCGNGEGTAYLKRECQQIGAIIGVDPAITPADGLIRFLREDPMRYWDTAGFTNIVCLATLEHLTDPRRFLMRTTGMLRNMGTLVASARVSPSIDSHPDHVSDLDQATLRMIGRECDLDEIACFPQSEPFDPSILNLQTYKTNPVALLSRIGATVCHGFNHRYLTIAWSKRA